MASDEPLSEDFYARDVLEVAPGLLGQRLVHRVDGQRIAGWIIETEAYNGEGDLACHARSGPTARNRVMYGPPGRAYVYFTYGLHWMMNCVTGPAGAPAAVLIRALWPAEGLDQMAARRAGRPQAHWVDGPAKLCQALGISGALNGANLTDPDGPLQIEPGPAVAPNLIRTGPRIGIDYAGEPWVSLPWRYWIDPAAIAGLFSGASRV